MAAPIAARGRDDPPAAALVENVVTVASARRAGIGGPDPSYFAVGDSLGTGVSQDLDDGRPVATETFGIGPATPCTGSGRRS